MLGISRSRTYHWIRKSTGLRVQRQGRRIFIGREDLDAFLGRLTGAPEPPEQSGGEPAGAPATAPAVPEHSNLPPLAHAPQVQTLKPASPQPVAPASARKTSNLGSGQRELRIPGRSKVGPMFVMFSGFEFVG
jgi:hypothetical protein